MENVNAAILHKLEQHNMHLHCVGDEKLPFHITQLDTHYVMQKGKVVFHGNLSMLAGFTNNLDLKR